MDVTGPQPGDDGFKEWPAMYGGMAAAEAAVMPGFEGAPPATTGCNIVFHHAAYGFYSHEAAYNVGYGTTGTAVPFCQTHGVRLDQQVGVTQVAMVCPIGRIEQARDEAIAAIKAAAPTAPLSDAVAAERERCARIAETIRTRAFAAYDYPVAIAEAIRRGSEP